MSLPSTSARRACAILFLCASPLAAQSTPTAGRANDPFAPGSRWSHAASASKPWIPRDVAFAAGGEWVWAGAAVASPHLMLLGSSQTGNAAPMLTDLELGPATGPILVQAGDQPDELFSLAQYATPAGRRTEVRRHDPLAAASTGAPFQATWVYDPTVDTDRPAFLAVDAEATAIVCAVYDGLGVRVDWLDPNEGGLVVRHFATGSTLSALALSDGGDRAALVCGQDLWVLARDGSTLLHESLDAATSALDLSADGRTLLVGSFAEVRAWVDHGQGFAPSAPLPGGAGELPTAIAIDAAGARAAVGWWSFANGVSVRLEVWDLATRERRVHREQLGTPGGPQNFPQAVAITADGRRAAFGVWGTEDGRPDALLVDVDADADVLAVDLLGSVQALALDPTGTRVAVARKDAHANAFAATGTVELFDSGERDLQLVRPPTLGGSLDLRARRAGYAFAIFAIGTPAAAPIAVPNWHGLAFVDFSKKMRLIGAPADADGTVSLELSIPVWPELVHGVAVIQALFLSPGFDRVSSSYVIPTVL